MIPLPTLSLISSVPPFEMLNALWLFAAVMVWPFRSMLSSLLLIERVPVNVISPLNWTFPPFVAAAVSPVKSETGVAVPLEVPPVASDSVIASSPGVVPPPPTVARAGAGIMLTAILTASAILINRFFICKSPLIKICSADLPRQESRTHPLLFCPRWANHQHHCNKFWSIWQCFKANCRISGKMAFQPAFRPEEGGDFSLTFAPVQHIIRSRM